MMSPSRGLDLVCQVLLISGCGRLGFPAREDGGTEVPSCEDGVQDGDEAGIDCGGSCHLACPAASCLTPDDCVTGSCVAGICELASGPPSWVPGPPLMTARGWLGCAVGADGRIYAIGGDTAGRSTTVITALVEALQPGSGGWTPAPQLAVGRYSHAVAADSAHAIFAAGGDNRNPSTMERFAAGTWTASTTMNAAHGWVSGAFGSDGQLYVADVSELLVYTPSTASWNRVGTPTQNRDVTATALASDGHVYITGGKPGGSFTNPRVGNVDRIDGTALTSVAAMGTARMFHGLVGAPDERLYAIGGFGNADTDLATVEAFTPSQNRWTPAAPLMTARSAEGATLGLDGRIYAVGGYIGSGVTATVEVYGPQVTSTPAAVSAGDLLTITGSNFAANATITGRIDDRPVPEFLTTTSDAGVASASFVVPALASGAHTLLVEDVKSQYPITAVFIVQ